MRSPINIHHVSVSIVYICKYCVCPHGPYGLLDIGIKVSIIIYDGKCKYCLETNQTVAIDVHVLMEKSKEKT